MGTPSPWRVSAPCRKIKIKLRRPPPCQWCRLDSLRSTRVGSMPPFDSRCSASCCPSSLCRHSGSAGHARLMRRELPCQRRSQCCSTTVTTRAMTESIADIATTESSGRPTRACRPASFVWVATAKCGVTHRYCRRYAVASSMAKPSSGIECSMCQISCSSTMRRTCAATSGV